VANGGIEGAPGTFGNREGKLDGGVEDLIDWHRDAGMRRDPPQLALRVKPIAQAFDFAEPPERPLDRVFRSPVDHLDGDDGPHQRRGPHPRVVHLALLRASTTAY